MAGRTQQISFGTWYSSSRQPGAREAAGRTQIVVAQDEIYDAAAVGDTVTATASVVNGTASAAAAAVGTTQTATASLPVSGTAIGAATAAGVTQTAAASLALGGTATGTAAAAGGTLTTTTLLVDGAAVGLGPLTARQYVIGGPLPLFVEESNAGREFIVGATFLSETLTGAAVDAAASGATVAATADIIAGTASATATGAAAGAIITASVSALSGTATGAANQAGDTVAATAALIAGTVTAGTGATASGATLAATATLIGGGTPEVFRQYAAGGLLPIFIDETATRQAIVSATFVEETTTAAVLWASGGASAGAELLTAVASVVSGAASGVANVSGATLTAAATLIAGTAIGGVAGDAFAEGALLEATASLAPGVATGESVIAIIGGGGQRMRFEPQDGLARGALIVCRARLIAGHASTLSLEPGAAHGSAEAANDNIPPVLVSLVAGTAHGQRSYSDSELLMIFAEAA